MYTEAYISLVKYTNEVLWTILEKGNDITLIINKLENLKTKVEQTLEYETKEGNINNYEDTGEKLIGSTLPEDQRLKFELDHLSKSIDQMLEIYEEWQVSGELDKHKFRDAFSNLRETCSTPITNNLHNLANVVKDNIDLFLKHTENIDADLIKSHEPLQQMLTELLYEIKCDFEEHYQLINLVNNVGQYHMRLDLLGLKEFYVAKVTEFISPEESVLMESSAAPVQEKSNIFSSSESSIGKQPLTPNDTKYEAGAIAKKYSLIFTHPEEGRFFTDAVNFEYSLNRAFNNIKGDMSAFSGFHMYRGEVTCSECDSDEDDCECENRTFDFDEAAGMVEYMMEQFEVIKYEIIELSTGDHDCINFLYELFSPILEVLPKDTRNINVQKQTENIVKALIEASEKYMSELQAYGKNSMPNIKLYN